ncbi:hypothetical protein ACFYXC_19375 [Streptomyces sp. NPDC002701]|uniref:hypothetical protein n=1 Tax=Streptomyces sp. NPDC002701 TaxID=3364661 RepID=UPI00369B1F5E
MTNPARISRRALLTRAAAIGTAVALPGSVLLSTPGYAAQKPYRTSVEQAVERLRERNARVLTGRPSRNGWEMENAADTHGSIYTRPVPGTPLEGIQVRLGEVETVLVHLVRRFHYEIDTLREGDVIGWRAPDRIRTRLPESNQASGTAVQIRPGHYPSGTRGGYFPLQVTVVRDILAELGGVVRWGGDDTTPDESLYYLDVRPGDSRLTSVARRLQGWRDTPGLGAGAPVDVLARDRRDAAKTLERRQRG